jgi:DNA polymerase
MPPAAPTPRFDPTATTRDWRATLREQAALPVRAPEPMPTLPLPDAAPRVAPAAWLTALEMPMGLQVGRSLPAVATDRSLESIATEVAACRACSLGARAINPVPREGNPHAEFVCVGEAPGQHEDEAGRPFVGPAGQLLEKILAAIQFARNDVFICNVLKHRPPGNRTPSPDEVRACRPFLEAQLAVVRPRVILALGTSAAHALLETTQSLGSLRGQIHHYYGVPLIVTYHPSALLRNEAWKRPAWQDVQLARRVFDASRQANPS